MVGNEHQPNGMARKLRMNVSADLKVIKFWNIPKNKSS